jgi:hypothetical protein
MVFFFISSLLPIIIEQFHNLLSQKSTRNKARSDIWGCAKEQKGKGKKNERSDKKMAPKTFHFNLTFSLYLIFKLPQTIIFLFHYHHYYLFIYLALPKIKILFTSQNLLRNSIRLKNLSVGKS